LDSTLSVGGDFLRTGDAFLGADLGGGEYFDGGGE
jgi:hypothetical protein